MTPSRQRRANPTRRGKRFEADDFARCNAFVVKAALSRPLSEIDARENRPPGADTRKTRNGLHIERSVTTPLIQR